MIDREKVLKGLECCCQMNGAVCRTECPYRDECIKNECVGTAHLCANALELLKEQPEQKHGHWEIVQDYYDDEHWQCSACGCEWYLEAGNPKENNMLYCPECGAKMDEEVKQDENIR